MIIVKKLIILTALPAVLIAMDNTLYQTIQIDPAGGNVLQVYIAKNQSKINKIQNDHTCDFVRGKYGPADYACITGYSLAGASIICWIDYSFSGPSGFTYLGGAMTAIGGSLLLGIASKKGYNYIMPWYLKRKQQKLLKDYQSIV